MAVVEVGLLGPVEVRADGHLRPLQRPQQGVLLAVLAVDAGRPVAVDVILDRVWGEAAPANARRTLHSHMSRLRRLVAGDVPDLLVRRLGGYQLNITPNQVDLHRFRSTLERARGGGPDRLVRLREALALWRGEPLAGLSGDWVARVRRSWQREYLDAIIVWAHAERAAGDVQAVTVRLAGLVDENPLLEPLWAAFLAALYARGRKAEALVHYATLQRQLAEELGADPGAELQNLHRAMLRDEPIDPSGPWHSAAAPVTPAQLPLSVAGFAGRKAELAHLDGVLAAATARDRPAAVVVSAISGTAGVGKTALAVHWAQRMAGRFSDGQLYANLRGFDPSGAPAHPADVVRGFLDAFGVPPKEVPAGFEAQVGLYRSLLAGKHVLVVLDNAWDEGQVRPLLPGAAGCLALVTSRNQLAGLVATEGAVPLTLDLFTVDEAREMLANRVGVARVEAEPDAADKIVSSCARLPLTLAIACARAATNPGLRLTALAEQLQANERRIAAFTGTDSATDVRAVFSWSYRTLGSDAARLFRLLGLHPGPSVSAPAAASLAGSPPRQVQPQLDELVAAHLLAQPEPGRFTLHDLLRVYATELAHDVDSEAERDAATGRMLDHYLHTANAADRLLNPERDPISLAPPRPGVHLEYQSGSSDALAWFAAEYVVLLAVLNQAASAGWDRHTWQLTYALTETFVRRGRWHDYGAAQRSALAAAHRLADPAAQILAHRDLAIAYLRLGRLGEARSEQSQALDLSTKTGDRAGQARAHHVLAIICERSGSYLDGLGHAQRALDLCRAAGHRVGQAAALNSIGWLHAKLGDYQQALAHCQQALEIHSELADQAGLATTWDSLGYAHHHLTQHDQAIMCFQNALGIYRDLGYLRGQVETLIHLGDTHHATSNLEAARTAWEQALVIAEEIDHSDAEVVRERLAEAGGCRLTKGRVG